MIPPTTQNLADLADACARLHDHAAKPDAHLATRRPEVSGWSIAEQLSHLAAANRLCVLQIAMLLRGRAEAASPPLVSYGLDVLERGTIPRGAATAPEMTVPPSVPGGAELREAFADQAARVAGFDAAAIDAAAGIRPHPLIGGMTAPQWVRFTVVHSRHHLAIIDDIERAAAAHA